MSTSSRGAVRARQLGRLVRPAVAPWLVTQALVVVAMAIAWWVRHRTSIELPPDMGRRADRYLLGWDSVWYERIAVDGYHGTVDRLGNLEVLRFFPLFPLAARLLGAVVGVSAALVALGSVGGLAGGAMVRHLALRMGGGGTRVADRAMWAYFLAPPAYVMAMGYTDGLAVALGAGALLAAHRRRWGPAMALGLLSGALRPTGVLLVVPIAIEAVFAARHHQLRRGQWRAAAAATVAPVLGCLAYLAYVQAEFGDWLLPASEQQVEGLRGRSVSPLVTIGRAIDGLAHLDLGLGAAYVTVVVAVALVVLGVRRLPLSAVVYGASVLLVGLSTQSLGSITRYVWGAAVPAVVLGQRLADRRRATTIVLSIGGATLLLVSATASFLGYLVP